MKRFLLAVLIVLGSAPTMARAQETAEQQISRAIAFYNDFRIEEARPILLTIVSPGYLRPVSVPERVRAYTYLGLMYASLNIRDTAITYFVAALDLDPFMDLDPTRFSGVELAAFAAAKQQIFKVAAQPLRSRVVVPRTDSAPYRFRLITTHRAELTVTLVNQAQPEQNEILVSSTSDGLRDIVWRGTWRGDSLPPPGIYELRIEGRSRLESNPQPVTERVLFRIDHSHEPLEQPIPPLTRELGQLLPEQYPTIRPWLDAALGAAIASTALATYYVAMDGQHLPGSPVHAWTAVTAGVATAAISFWYRRNTNRVITANQAENRRRQEAWTRYNALIQSRNEERLGRTLLVITPVAR